MKTIIKAGTCKEAGAIETANRALARRAAAEGFVLLENDGVLPLCPRRIALYGSGARMTVKGGTGSGAVRERYSVTIEQGLLDAGFEIASTPWLDRFDRFYAQTYEAYRAEMEARVAGITDFYQILNRVTPFQHPTGIPITQEDIDCSATDTAIFILARQAGEGNDRRNEPGDYQLDELEEANLAMLSKGYSKLIVVVNSGGMIDLSFLDKFKVNALVFFGQGGEEGGSALADVLSGGVNFSGRLASSWPRRFEDLPSASVYSHLGKDIHNQDYREGLYVGYRYFDTFSVRPRYPFGYGLSYTCFSLSAEQAALDGESFRLTVCAANAGLQAGRQTVQLYATVPFGTDGAEYQRLVAFEKTGCLEAGAGERMTLCVPLRSLACYDEEKAAWVLRAGRYVMRLGDSSANTKPAAVLTLDRETVVEQCMNLFAGQRRVEEIAPPARAEENVEGVPVLAMEGHLPSCVRHSYELVPEQGDPLTDSMSVRQLAQLVCGGTTSPTDAPVTAMGASGTTCTALYETAGIPNVILADGPAGLNLTGQIVELPDGTVKAALVPENLEAYKRYLFGASGAAITRKMADPASGTVHYQYCTAWPCAQLLAQTFDTDLLEQVGDAVGREMEAYGVTVWLAPGMNIQRNPLCGRTFEYYSEDPLVSGMLAAAIVRGVQSHPGKGMSVKHFAANSCELERNASSSNVSERALRELYLKGFEIAVRQASPWTVMAAYNKINGVYCTNNHDLLVKLLRCEWGFDGLVMSDWDSMKADRSDPRKAVTGDVLRAPAAQCDLIMPGRPDQVEALCMGVEAGEVRVEDLRRSAARVLRMIRRNTVLKMADPEQ